ncbi:MAG: DUF488 family protein [Methanothrix sp.]|nr:DUF488 family protein [Methanothrix sp.]
MLSTGEKSIIFLLHYNNSRISKLRLVKLMFLISRRSSIYDFIPYKYGPFSFTLYHDLSKLEKDGYVLIENENVDLIKSELPQIENRTKNIIRMYSQQFINFDDNKLIKYIYDAHPKYTIFSLYMKNANYIRDSRGVTTIGYEGKSIDKFLEELIENKINILIDVRKNAYSRKFGFHGNILKKYLNNIDIDYMHMPELGIDSDLRKDLKNIKDYKNLFDKYKEDLKERTSQLEEIKKISENKKISLMCFEKNIEYCHRGILAELLRIQGIEVEDL